MVAGSTENPCMSSRRPREPSRSPPRRPWRPPEPPGPPPRRPPTPPDPPRRGIRGGAAARRRREAYIVNLGGDRETIPVVHAGGQRRPLGASRFWEPSASEAESDEVEIVAHTSAVDLTSLQAEHLVPRSRLYNPYVFDHSPGSSSLAAAPRPVPSRADSSVVDTPAGNRPYGILKYYHPAPGVVLPPWSRVDIVYREALTFPSSAKFYAWANGDTLMLAAERPDHWGSDPVIALDYHQVLDVDRSVNPPDRVDHIGNLPAGHVAAVRRLRREIEEVGLRCRVKIIVLSHIHDSVVNERNLITAVQQSSLSVDCVIITRERTGPGGKFEVLRSLTRGQAVILDDNVEVLREFSAASLIAIQIRKPRVGAIFDEEQRSWSFSAPWLVDRLVAFVHRHSNPVDEEE